MKIALIGSAPSSVRLAPYGDPTWKIWACSPGVYAVAPRTDEWFELHRWEPPVLGNPAKQVPWFSPEYVGWMSQHPCVWVSAPAEGLPNARILNMDELIMRYGHYFLTSSIAWMAARAIDVIMEARTARAKSNAEAPPGSPIEVDNDAIGFWGVDMAASEEYGYQRAGCQFFVQMASSLGIEIVVPPESDLLLPPPLYGAGENSIRAIKWLARKRELEGRLAAHKAQREQLNYQIAMLEGAVDDTQYYINNWSHEGDVQGADFRRLFGPPEDNSAA